MSKGNNNRHALPKDWKWVKLGDICEVVTGTTPPKSDSSNYGIDIPFFKPPHLWDAIIIDTEEKLSFKGADKARIVPPNTVLVTCIGNLGRTGFVKQKSAFNQQINAILENETISGKYIFYQAQSPFFKKQLERLATGTTVSIVNKGNFETIEIPLPPLPTQLAIVSKIEELFSELDKGIEQLKTAQQQLKTYRQSVLSAGTSGVLTGSTNEFINVVTIGQPTILIKEWKVFKLTDVAKLESGHTPRKDTPEYWENGDILWLSLQDIRALDGKIAMDTKYKTNKLGIENSSARLLPKGTVCFCRDISVGYVTIMGQTMSTTQHFANWICSSAINNKFLMFSFMASRDSLIRQGQGTTVKTIYMPDLKEMRIQLPPIEKQKQIVSEIESRLSVADKLEESINNSLQQAEALRQSILKKAFEGRLV